MSMLGKTPAMSCEYYTMAMSLSSTERCRWLSRTAESKVFRKAPRHLLMPSEKNQDQQRVGDISAEFDVKSALSGLGDKYQAAGMKHYTMAMSMSSMEGC